MMLKKHKDRKNELDSFKQTKYDVEILNTNMNDEYGAPCDTSTNNNITNIMKNI
jgi:hypothetical protein